MWVDLCTRQGSFIELQVDSDHPSHGHVGCSLLIQTAVIKVCVGGGGGGCVDVLIIVINHFCLFSAKGILHKT